jgi:hypothetical protein
MLRFPKLSSNAVACLFGAFVFALFGVFMFPWMLWSRARVEAMIDWTTAQAEIVKAGATSRFQKGAGTQYQHSLNYRFSVGDHWFVGDRVSYGGPPPQWNSEAEARASLPTIGSKIQVRYDPRDPSDSVVHLIRVSDSSDLVIRWVAGGIGAAGGVLMLISGSAWRAEKR